MTLKKKFRARIDKVLSRSLDAAAKDQDLLELSGRLKEIVPDLSDQYSQFAVSGELLEKKVRFQHAFQMNIAQAALASIDEPVIVDIGDSSGTHLIYLKKLFEQKQSMRALSVNLDAAAVEKIRAKGLEAVHSRAEDLAAYDVNANVFLCLETLEHLSDPISFLHALAGSTKEARLVVTVPYLKHSRIGLHHIRQKRRDLVHAENTHILELSPQDWKLLFRHSGWEIEHEQIYRQYPRGASSLFLKRLWRRFDFEGFFGVVLKLDNTWSSLFKDW